MKKAFLLGLLLCLQSGCLYHTNRGAAEDTEKLGRMRGVEATRGTTGVSTGAQSGPVTTGSDLAPP